jgi:hypothetical protein
MSRGIELLDITWSKNSMSKDTNKENRRLARLLRWAVKQVAP